MTEQDKKPIIDELEPESTDIGADEEEEVEDELEPELESEPELAPEPSPRPLSIPLPVAPVLDRTSRFLWGAPSQAQARPAGDLEDLFKPPGEDDNDTRIDDLIELDEADITGGDFSDLLTVSHEDIMGRKLKSRRPRRVVSPYNPPPSMGGTR